MNIKKFEKGTRIYFFRKVSGLKYNVDVLRYKDIPDGIIKMNGIAYKNKIMLKVKDVCYLLHIKHVPDKYKEDANKFVYESKLIDKLENKKDIVKNIDKCDHKLKKYLSACSFFRNFRKKYYSVAGFKHNDTELLEMAIESFYLYWTYGFNFNDYYDYEMYNKKIKDLDKFLNSSYRNVVYRACNSHKYTHYLKNKFEFNEKFKNWIYREYLNGSKCTKGEFEEFVKKHKKFFVKPIGGTGGAGATILEYDGENLNKLFKYVRKHKVIVEEIVKQDKEFASFNKDTLNTIRLYTLYPLNGKPYVTMANARFGRAGNAVDNFHSGGVSAGIDIKKGVLCTDAINRAHEFYKEHPDSKKKFKGFVIPHWDKFVDAVCSAAETFPEMRHIGWDVCLNSKGNVEFIEGNGWPNFDITQAVDQIGKKDRYEKTINELIEAKKVK